MRPWTPLLSSLLLTTATAAPTDGPLTEITTWYLQPGTRITVPGVAKDIWDAAIHTLSQVPGAQGMWLGEHLANPDNLQVVIQYLDQKSQDDFVASPAFPPLVANLSSIARPPGNFFTRSFFPFSTRGAVSAPLSEFLYQYVSFAKNPGYGTRVIGPLEKEWEKTAGVRGVVSTETLDDVENTYFGGTGGKGRVWVSLAGWKDKRAYEGWVRSEGGRRVDRLVEENTEGVETVLVKLRRVF